MLKVLQSKEIERVGGVKTISLDIKIIAATNRNLEEMVKLHQFREDLWFRLRVLSKTKGKVNGPDGAAAFLGINPSTLRIG